MSDEPAAGRAGRALALAALIAVVAGFAAWKACLGEGPDRFVQDSAPRQVVAPDRRPREAGRAKAKGERADLSLPDLSGRMTSLAEHRGKVVVLNMWASWCPPCLEEMPSLEALHRAGHDDLVVVGVCVDEGLAGAREVVRRLGLTLPVLLDPGGERCASWGTVKFPETWIVDPQGIVRERVVGPRDWMDLDVVRELQALR